MAFCLYRAYTWPKFASNRGAVHDQAASMARIAMASSAVAILHAPVACPGCIGTGKIHGTYPGDGVLRPADGVLPDRQLFPRLGLSFFYLFPIIRYATVGGSGWHQWYAQRCCRHRVGAGAGTVSAQPLYLKRLRA
jgi:hypothetical protein